MEVYQNTGICRSIARVLICGPTKYQGLGVNTLFVIQGILHIREKMSHIWLKIETHKLLQKSIEYANLEVMISKSLFKLNHDLFGHLCEETWVKHLWKFIFHSDVEDLVDFESIKEGDIILVRNLVAILNSGTITKTEWSMVNKCRKYLKY